MIGSRVVVRWTEEAATRADALDADADADADADEVDSTSKTRIMIKQTKKAFIAACLHFLLCFALLCFALLGLAWLGLAWFGLVWFGLVWLTRRVIDR
jgi:4-hydroxybenzoate polyprenyltransferase